MQSRLDQTKTLAGQVIKKRQRLKDRIFLNDMQALNIYLKNLHVNVLWGKVLWLNFWSFL